MKRLLVFVALTLVLSFGLVQAQTTVSLDNVSSEVSATQIATGNANTTFDMRVTNLGSDHYNPNNGLSISSPDGATWGSFVGTTLNAFNAEFTQYFINHFSDDGMGADSVGFSGVSFDPTAGLSPGWDQPSYRITIGLLADADTNKTICIDSTWTPPGGTWKWAALTPGPDVLPGWSGQRCWTLYKVPDIAPDAAGPANVSGAHCDVMTAQFTATDTDACPSGPVVYDFFLVSGPGAIDPATGVWSWQPSMDAVQAGNDVVVVGVTDCGGNGGGATATMNVTVTNAAPAFTGGCGESNTVQTDDSKNVQMTASDEACDALAWTVAGPSGLNGSLTIDASGLVTFAPVAGDEALAQPIVATVTVSDGGLDATCDIEFTVIAGAPYTVSIVPGQGYNQICDGFLQGQFATLNVVLDGVDPNQGIGGFDLLISYDNSALSFQSAVEGEIFGASSCNWEYFTYRFGANGNCSGGCPSGLLRIIGVAEQNDGVTSNTCGLADPVGPTVLAELTFLVSNDRTLECQRAFVRFFWVDCGDNTLSNLSGSQLYISAKVFEPGNPAPISADGPLPTYTGAPDLCVNEGPKGLAKRNVDFTNGMVKICCADQIDARGDINLNNLAYEIADAVMLTNYFIDGLGAFGTHQAGSAAASDVNADGIALSVADLVYLIRVVVGDALPYYKTVAVNASWNHENGVVNVDSDMGAALIIVSGDQTPKLLAENMEMKSRYDGTNTRILVFSTEAGNTFSGNFVAVEGDVVSIELATYDGTPVAAKNIPSNFALEQNYPNPFNPTTNIAFSLTEASDWSITIYNVTGQVVETFSGNAEAGTHVVTWDASQIASGIYFYKLVAGNNSETRKAALLK